MQKRVMIMNKKNIEKIEVVMTAKVLIAITAITHLVFTSIHVDVLLLLENEICGFVMFLFVLFGLVALFETSRIKEEGPEKIFTILFNLLTSAMGIYLVAIYQEAIRIQASLEIATVRKAIIFSEIIIGAYMLSSVLLGVGIMKESRRAKNR